jgi:hypothetical protein
MISWVYGPAVKKWFPKVVIGHKMCGDRGCTTYAIEYEEHVQTVFSSLPDRMYEETVFGEGYFSEFDYVITKSNNAGPDYTVTYKQGKLFHSNYRKEGVRVT